ncbi:MAG: PHP domain-containing protein [Candidatus Lokiarchaeota archaeon]|nr:PHP domain-containing protein [Candidatus Lokiarchaeota archaeon]
MDAIKPLKSLIPILVPAIPFVAWLVFLIWTSTFSSRSVTFYDALHQVDVSTQYTSIIPPERYFLEPFAGFAFTLAKQLEDSLILIPVVYVVIRFVFAFIEKVIFRGSVKKDVLVQHARNVFNFYWKYAFLAFLVIFLVIIAGMVVTGVLFLHQTFMTFLQIAFVAWLAMLGLKIAQNAVIFFKRNAKLRVKPPKSWMRLSHDSPKYWVHKTWDVVGREPRYLLTALMIYVTISLNLVSTYFPPQVITPATPLQSGEMIMDFHCHTTLSDGYLTPEERVDWYIKQGLQGAAITDHMNVNGALQAREYVRRMGFNFTIIIGQEYTKYSPRIHLNVFGIEETIPTDEYLGGSTSPSPIPAMNVSQMIAYVKSHGGFVTVNHYDSTGEAYSLVQLRDWGVDGFEIVNGGGIRDAGIRTFCMANNLICLSASDEDSSQPLPAFTRFKLADPSNRSLAAIFTALKNYSTTQCIAVNQVQNGIAWPDALDDFRPLRNFIVYLRSSDTGQLMSWIAWSCGFFAFYVAFWLLITKKIAVESRESKLVEDPRKRSFLFAHPGITIGCIATAVVIGILVLNYLWIIYLGWAA